MVYFNPSVQFSLHRGKADSAANTVSACPLFVWMGVGVERGGGAFRKGSWEHESLGNDPSNLQNQL